MQIAQLEPAAGPLATIDNDCWYAAYTCARHEKRVADQLQNRNIQCFLPLYESVHRWKDRRARVQLPLFPGYVFIQIPLRERLQVLEVSSVVHLVSFNGVPAPLPTDDIERLRRGLGSVAAQPHPYLTVGRRVRIKSGPFEGMEGILQRRKNSVRLVVSIELIMRSILLDIDSFDVEPLLPRARVPVNRPADTTVVNWRRPPL